jgi:hypothetical protein
MFPRLCNRMKRRIHVVRADHSEPKTYGLMLKAFKPFHPRLAINADGSTEFVTGDASAETVFVGDAPGHSWSVVGEAEAAVGA